MPQNSKTLNDITESDLIKALQDAIASQPDVEPNTITRREYQEAVGLSAYKAGKQLAALVKQEVLKPDYIQRVNAWGERQSLKGYRYVGDAADN